MKKKIMLLVTFSFVLMLSACGQNIQENLEELQNYELDYDITYSIDGEEFEARVEGDKIFATYDGVEEELEEGFEYFKSDDEVLMFFPFLIMHEDYLEDEGDGEFVFDGSYLEDACDEMDFLEDNEYVCEDIEYYEEALTITFLFEDGMLIEFEVEFEEDGESDTMTAEIDYE